MPQQIRPINSGAAAIPSLISHSNDFWKGVKVLSLSTAVCAVIGISIYYLIQRIRTCWSRTDFSQTHQLKTFLSIIFKVGPYTALNSNRQTRTTKIDFSQDKLLQKFYREVSKIDEPSLDQESVIQSILTSDIWSEFKDRFHLFIDDSRPLYDQVIRSIFNRVKNLHSNPQFVRDILDNQSTILKKTEMAYDNPVYALKAASTLLKWLEAHDTLIVWKELGCLIGVSTPQIETLLSLEDAIDEANNFSEWIKSYKRSLSEIEELDLRQRKLSFLPESTFELSALRKLNLSHNQLIDLSSSIGQLSFLQTLNLSHNQLTSLPDAIGQLSALQGLNLSYNQLTALPDSLDQLKSLEWLVLPGNQLTSLPDSVGQLSALQWLDLSGNQLTVLTDRVGQLSALQWLDLSYNQLTVLPDSIGQLSALQKLNLSHNQLAILTGAIGQLSALRLLDLSHNKLIVLPDSVGQLSALQTLNLSDNKLTSLPDSVGQLSALQTLNLPDNKLTSLPNSVGQLSALKQLDLSFNEFTSLPFNLARLPSHTTIVAHWNPLSILAIHNFRFDCGMVHFPNLDRGPRVSANLSQMFSV